MLEDFYLGNRTVWEYEIDEKTEEAAKRLMKQLKIPALLSKVLAKRGFFDIEAIKAYLRPSIKALHDPMLLSGMDTVTERILTAREAGEKTIIYGDYDVDGITATSILAGFLQSIGMDVSFYIPDRTEEGYGISEAAVEYLLSTSYDLMITVDCGISARERIAELQTGLAGIGRKMDIIITDHHQPDADNIPEALAIVNPHLPDNTYPFQQLCGAGIAFKLVQALCMRLNLADRYLDYVDLAALGTVADIVALSGENRILVWAGLKKIQRCPNNGIYALLKVSQAMNREIDTWLLGFVLAPRINAAGRMGNAARGVRLFTTQDTAEAESIAMQMNQDNTLRQRIQEEIYKKAVEAIEGDSTYKNEKVIVVYGDDWHHGVIGIVASLLTERYCKPCFVLSARGDIATGSARSVGGFNVFSAMEFCRDLFIKYGGHEQAGGLTIKTGDIGLFRKKVNEYAALTMSPGPFTSKIRIDAISSVEELDLKAAEWIMAMAPFGEENPDPVFRLNNVTVLQKKRIGASGEHLRLLLGSGNHPVQAIAFRMGELEPCIPDKSTIDLVFTVGINEYMGSKNLQLMVKAIRVPEFEICRNRALLEAAEKVECLDYDEEWIYNGINNHRVSIEDIKVSKDDLAALYRYLKKLGSHTLNRAQLFRLAEEISRNNVRINYFKLLSGMFIFDELDIIRFAVTESGDYDLKISEILEKASLEDSQLYTFLQDIQQVAEK